MIRTHPFPYKSALTFANDTDFMTLEVTLALHRYLAEEPANGGIGLDVSDSFFFYTNRSEYPCYSYFRNLAGEEEPHAGLLRELVSQGYLDTTHAWGDFNGGGFSRRAAEMAAEAFARHGLALKAWSNHGGGMNIQCIGQRHCFNYQQGDDINRPFYHLDILEDIGVRYVWVSDALTRNIHTQPIGGIVKERRRKAPRKVFRWGWQRIWESHQTVIDHDSKSLFKPGPVVNAECDLQVFNRFDPFLLSGNLPKESILKPDGRRAGPNIGRLSLQINKENLDLLVKNQGATALYQHFSTLWHLPKRTHITKNLEFHPDNIQALRLLKKYQDEGKVWVPSLGTFLDYYYMINTVAIRVDSIGAGSVKISVSIKKGYEYRGIEGLTVEVPEGTEKAIFADPNGNEFNGRIVLENNTTYAQIPVKRLPKVDWLNLAKDYDVAIPETITVTRLNSDQPPSLWEPTGRQK